jgi:hypothetical protein
MVAEGSFLSSQDHEIGPYSEPAECGSDIHTHLFKIRLLHYFPFCACISHLQGFRRIRLILARQENNIRQ